MVVSLELLLDVLELVVLSALNIELSPLVSDALVELGDRRLQALIFSSLLLLVFLQLLDLSFLGVDVGFVVLLLGLVQLGVSLVLHLLLFVLLNLVLLLLNFLFFLQQLALKLNDFLVESSFGELKVVDLLLLALNFLLQLFLLSDQLVDSVVLAERQPGTLLDNFVELSDFILKTLDDSSGLLLLVLGSLDKFPALFNLPPEHSDGV